MNFFARDAILSAKELLYYELNTQGRVISHVKDDKSIIAMVKLLVSAVKEKKNMPRFVIFSICETPVIGDAVSATLASKVNGISRKIDGFIDLTTRSLLNVNSSNTEKNKNASTSATYNSQSVKPSYDVVLKIVHKI